MKITVEISIDDTLIQTSADTAARALFRAPEYGNPSGAPGYARIAEQVEAAVVALDFSEIAREAASKFAKGIIEDVTKETIKRMAKEAVKAEKEAGTLL